MDNPFASYRRPSKTTNNAAPSTPVWSSTDALYEEMRQSEEEERRNAIRAKLNEVPDAKKVNRANRIAREKGIPPQVAEAEEDLFKVTELADRMMGVATQYSGLGRWMDKDPRNVASVSDDVDNLSGLGKTFEDIRKDFLTGGGFWEEFGDTIMRGAYSTQAGLARFGTASTEFLEGLTPPAQRSQAAKENYAKIQPINRERAKFGEAVARLPVAGEVTWEDFKADKTVGNLAKASSDTFAGSIAEMGTALAAGPVAVLAMMGRLGQERAVNNGKAEADMWDVTKTAPAALVSVYLEKLGIQKIFSPTYKTVWGRILGALGYEAGTEFIQEGGESVAATLGTDKGFDAAETLDQATAGAVMGGVIGGTIRTAAETPAITKKAAQTAIRSTAKIIQKAESARQGRANAKYIEKLDELMQNNKLRQEDPEKFAELLKTLAEDSGVTDVYVPVDELFQMSEELEPDSPEAQWIAAQELNNEAVGTEIRIPIERLHEIAGTDLMTALKPNMRLRPTDATLTEAEAIEAGLPDDIAAMFKNVASESEMTEGSVKLRENIRNKLSGAGLDASQVETQVAAIANQFEVRAKERGEEIRGDEYTPTVVTVLPDGIKKYREGGKLDEAIAAMRAPVAEDVASSVEDGVVAETRNTTRDTVIEKGGEKNTRIMEIAEETSLDGAQKRLDDADFELGQAETRLKVKAVDFAEEVGPAMDNVDAWAEYSEKEAFAVKELSAVKNFAEMRVRELERNATQGATETVTPAPDVKIAQAAKDLRKLLIENDLDPETASREQIAAVLNNMVEAGGDLYQSSVNPETGDSENRISTRQPTTQRATEDPLTENLSVGLDAMKASPSAFEANMQLLRSYIGFKTTANDPDTVASDFINFVKDNLRWLYDQTPAAIRERSKLWYDGANKIADRWSDQFGVPDFTVAGVLAALSPQKDWYQNVSLAERVLDIHTRFAEDYDFVADKKMQEKAAEIYGKPSFAKKLPVVMKWSYPMLPTLELKAMWLRIYDQTYNPRGFRQITSEGEFIGKPSGKVAWGSNVEIAKAIYVLRHQTREQASVAMGTKHKVRNFFNNILAPNAPHGDVTIDTHAVAAGLLRPLSGNSAEVHHNFGSSPEKKKQPKGWKAAKNIGDSGASGTYGIYADAYRELAAELGILPRELQSITWEAARGLFPAKEKRAKKIALVSAVWDKAKTGKITPDEARAEISEIYGGIDEPTWYGSSGGGDVDGQRTSYEGKLARSRVSRETTRELDAGDGDATGTGGPEGRRGTDGSGGGQAETELRGEQTGDGGGRPDVGEIPPLEGAPRNFSGPIERIVAAAEGYAAKIGINLKRQAEYAELDTERAERIAAAYEALKHDPKNPEVKAAYKALIEQTRAQYDVLVEAGYTFTFFGKDDPYDGNGWNALRDLRDNNTMAVYSTKEGYGMGELPKVAQNPMMKKTGLEWPDQNGNMQPVLANDLFRAVHDAFGHGLEGAGFRAEGEENAWQAHVRLFTGKAVGAITTETRGQNSWLNYGPFGETNRTAKLKDTEFADQKIGLMPEWTWTEGRVEDEQTDRSETLYQLEDTGVDPRRSGVSGQRDSTGDGSTVFPDLERPPVNEDGTITLDHFSLEEGLGQTDPARWGRSGGFLSMEEQSRMGSAPNRTYFGYATNRGGYKSEFPDGRHPRYNKPVFRVTTRVPAESIYDMHGDPDGLKQVGVALPKAENGKYIYKGREVDSVSLYELLIKDAGYKGYWTPKIGGTVALFEAVEVQPYDAARDDYQPEGQTLNQAATLPATININGTERSTTNSEGNPLAQTEEGVRNFWDWFGDSKVVDGEGRPLVMHHGSPSKEKIDEFREEKMRANDYDAPFNGFWFSADENTLPAFVGRNSLTSVYLRISNPAPADNYNGRRGESREAMDTNPEATGAGDALRRILRGEGFDGVEWEAPPEINTEELEATGKTTFRTVRGGYYTMTKEPIELPIDGNWINKTPENWKTVWSYDLYSGKTTDNHLTGYLSAEDYQSQQGHTWVAFSPNQIKSVDNNGQFDPANPNILNQGTKQQPQGSIQFRDKNGVRLLSPIIRLFEGSNLSSLQHEMAHFWFDLMQQDVAGLDPNDDSKYATDLRARWSAVSQWLKRNKVPLNADGTIPENAHELFARSWEQYLMEGKSPSSAMRKVFNTMRSWMTSVYRSIKSVPGGKISPQIREVFDRMVATEEEIEAGREEQGLRALFDNLADWGGGEKDFDDYVALGDEAKIRAEEELLKSTMSVIRQRVKKEYAGALKLAREDAEEEVDAMPVFRALAVIKDDNAMDLEMLKDIASTLPRRVPPIMKEGGLHPDRVAEVSGFSSGDELIKALQRLEADAKQLKDSGDNRGVRKSKIETAAQRLINERYGDPLTDGTIEREAITALQNIKQGEVLAAELKQLGAKTNKRPTAYQTAKQWAEEKVASGIINDVASGAAQYRYSQAAAKAGRAAEKAYLAGDNEEAFKQKQIQMLQTALSRAAADAYERIEIAVRRMSKLAKQRVAKTLPLDYLDRIHGLLEDYEFKNQSQAAIDRRAELREWIAEMEDQGRSVDLPEYLLDNIDKTHWSRMKVEDLLTLDTVVQQIKKLGMTKEKLLTSQKNREVEQTASDMEAAILSSKPKTLKNIRSRETLGHKWLTFMKGFAAIHRKMASFSRQMDGVKDNGPVWEALIRPMNERYNFEATEIAGVTQRLSEILGDFLGRDKFGRPIMGGGGMYFESIDASFNLGERMGIVGNMGNEGNLQRLIDGERGEYGMRWTLAQVNEIKDSLTKEQMDAVQAIWDLFEEFKPRIAEKERRVSGVEPEWIEPVPLETKHGTYRGGYWPVKYDPRKSLAAHQQADADEAQRQLKGAYTAATTNRSFTKSRADKVVGRPLMYGLSAVTGGLTDVVHDLAFHEYLIDANRLLRHPKVSAAIINHYGPEVLTQFTKGIEDVAQGPAAAQNVFEQGVNHVRMGATIAGLGWNFFTAALQPIGLTQSMVRVGPKWIAKGVANWLKSPTGVPEGMFEKSEFMQNRAATMQREINEIRNRIQGKTKTKEFLDASFFVMITKMQLVVDIPTWSGAYEKAHASGVDEATAVALADQAVIDAQGGGQQGHLSAIQRGGPLQKLFTNFYSFFNTTYNLSMESVSRTNFKKPGDIMALAMDYLLLYTIPASMGYFLRELYAAAKGDDDDDEASMLEGLISENLSFMMGSMVGLRETTGAVQSLVGAFTDLDVRPYKGSYGGPAGLRALQEIDRLGKQSAQGELDRALRKSMVGTAGVLFHLPGGQINRTWDGMNALIEDETDNPAVLVTGS